MNGVLVVQLDLSGGQPRYLPRHLVPQCVPCPFCKVRVGEWCRSNASPWNTVPFHAGRRRTVEEWTDDQCRVALAALAAERARTGADVRG